MRIGMFTDTYAPQVNGVVTSINTVKKELERTGHEVFVFAPRVKKSDQLENVFYFSSAPWPTSPEHHLSFPYALHLKKFAELKLDVIHSHTPFSLGWLAVFLGKKYDIPILHTYHTLFTEYLHYIPLIGGSDFLDSVARRTLGRNYCAKCQRIVVPSSPMKKELQEWGVKQDIDIVPTGIDILPALNADGELIRKRYGISKDKKIVTYMGRLAKEKNISFLFKVYKKIVLVRKDVLFVVIGDGPYRSYLEQLAYSYGLQDNILFTGYVKDRELLYSWLKSTDVFAFASLTETQGLVVLEAMAAGTPVVAVNSMGVMDVISDNLGGQASELDVSEFALKLTYLLADEKLLQKKGEEALVKVANFTIEKMTAKLVASYEAIV